jgi:LacI family transcriptional regulator
LLDRSLPTIYDVARAAAVSPSTVSRAFARPGRVSHGTAERIFAAAAEVGYRSTHVAGNLHPAGEKRSVIALVIADMRNPVFAEIARGAEAAAAANGYVMLLAHTQESERRERLAIERLLPVVDGIVLTSSRMPDLAIRMIARQKPTIVMNRVVSDVPSVVSDNASGIRRAAEHLRDLGHHSIAYLAGPEASWADGMRWRSLREAASELELGVRRLGLGVPTVRGGEDAAPEWLQNQSSAVIAYNDQMAMGFIRALQQRGISVPDEISVVGFDNSYETGLVSPALTTVEAPLYALGSSAVTNLLAFARGAQSQSGQPLVLPTRLIVRGSTTIPGGLPASA